MSAKGATLAELLVSTAIFSLLLTAVVLIEVEAHRLRRSQNKRSDAYRAAVLLVEFLQSDLDGAYVVPGCDGDSQLCYRPVVQSGPNLALGISGSAQQESEVSLKKLLDGRVVRQSGGLTRHVSTIGAQGRLTFEFPSTNLLRVKIHAEPETGTFYDTLLQVLLCNQS
jgi:hypothetical protein